MFWLTTSNRKYCLALVQIPWLLICGASISKTLMVPEDFASLAIAIDSASTSDTIRIGDGIFSGDGFRNIYMNPQKGIVILSTNGSTNTTIDCGQSSFLTITDTFQNGGQLLVRDLTIRNCYNAMTAFTYSNVSVTSCNIVQCNVGFVDWTEGSIVKVDSCRFLENGIGLEIHADSKMRLTHNVIANNETGAYWNFVPAGIMENNTFVNNYTALQLVLFGSQIRNNCLTLNNIGLAFGGAFYDSILAELTYRNNNVYGNFAADYWNVPNQTGRACNFSLDPKYCDHTFTDFHVASISPLLPVNNSCATTVGLVQGVSCYCGDVDVSGNVDISDITSIISYLYLSGPPPNPLFAGEIDGQAPIDIADLSRLIDYLYISFTPLPCGT